MVAREPGESDADYELRQRDHRHSKSRCLASSSSEEEEEEKESRAAGSAAGSELGAAGSAAPVVIAEEREEKEESIQVDIFRLKLRGQQLLLVVQEGQPQLWLV